MNKFLIGSISANIAGDHRYTDTCQVKYDADANNVVVEVFSTGALGGMDGPGGRTEPRAEFNETCKAEPKAVLALVKRVMKDGRYNFKTYGKPTKRFSWAVNGRMYDPKGRGLNLALVTKALNCKDE